jgi:threonine dehydrogenase-like Zn-dependent dehydrogenase
MGSWAAGVVRMVGPDVHRFRPGDLVHGEWKHRETAIKTEGTLYAIPAQVESETMVFSDPARFALAAVHDAQIKLGDRVAIFGLGAIGLLAVQMALLSGASQVMAIDPIAQRRSLAVAVGAHDTFDPTACDAGLAIKEATGGHGVDVALEISGVYSALQHAIRGVRREGLVVTASYYGDTAGRVDFSREWHHNRITLRSSMPVWGCSHRCYPLWDMNRIEHTAIRLLETGKLAVKPLIGARIPFARAAEAYAMIDLAPAQAVKVVLTYEH